MSKLRNIKTVITDLDNTLVPFANSYASYVNCLVKGICTVSGLSEHEVAKGFNQIYLNHGVFQFEDAIGHHALLTEKYPNVDLEDKFAKEIAQAKKVLIDTCKPSDNVVESLKELKKQGIKLVLFSAGPASFTLDKMESAGLSGIFDNIYAVKDKRKNGQEEAILSHPNSEWSKVKLLSRFPKTSISTYQKILEDLNAKPEETVMMGDNSYQDIFIPKKIGIRTILVTGYRDNVVKNKLFRAVLAKQPLAKIKKFFKTLKAGTLFKNQDAYADVIITYPSEITKVISNKKTISNAIMSVINSKRFKS